MHCNYFPPCTLVRMILRARFELRWLKSLSASEIPIMILWGDADAVAPIEIAKSLAAEKHVG